ncbi:MAG: hypothetical protein HYU36_00695 [Planctomycetes bacterium]|nr:hypothetical protein [Planctomycetota bacterium]
MSHKSGQAIIPFPLRANVLGAAWPLLLLWWAEVLCRQAGADPPPSMRLPPCQHVPTIDGEVKPGEWDEAFAGFGLIGERRAARYFLTYDGRTLYAAMQTELPPWGRIDGKIRRLPFEVFQDDHFELHINPPREPEDPDKAYYQLVGNARDCFWNSQHTEQNPGFLPFNGDWTFRNSVKDGWWTWELSTPVHALGKARITPETTWGFKFVRCWHQPHAENFWPSGGYFDRSSYFQVALDASAPVVQLEDFGKWWEGRSDIVLGLRNLTVRPLAVKAFFRLEGGGTEARTLEQEATLAAWDPAASPAPPRETVRFSQSWAAGKEASLSLRVTSPDGQKVYFSDVRPFPKPPDGPLWVAAVEKKEEIAFRAFFYPGVSRLRCEVSFGHLKQASAVTRALLVVMDAGGGEITRSEATRFIEGDADPLIPLPPGLPQGRYEVRLSLFAGDQQVAGPLTSRSCSRRPLSLNLDVAARQLAITVQEGAFHPDLEDVVPSRLAVVLHGDHERAPVCQDPGERPLLQVW